MARPPIKVACFDDHPIVRSGLAAILASRPELTLVGQGSSGEEAIDLVRSHPLDLVLLDLKMPGMGGVEATAILSRMPAAPRILILTTFAAEDSVRKALEAGASGYLLKSAPGDEVVQAIIDIMHGRKVIGTAPARALADSLGYDDLTPRELSVLRSLSRGHGNKAIAAELGISEGTVRTHLQNIFSKLGCVDRVEALVIAAKRGLIDLDSTA